MVEFTIHSLLTIVIYLYVRILSTLHSWKITKKSHLHVLQLLLAVPGNYMNNIKPNLFLGIRLPWTLSDENNWCQTHYLGATLRFSGGIILGLIS